MSYNALIAATQLGIDRVVLASSVNAIGMSAFRLMSASSLETRGRAKSC